MLLLLMPRAVRRWAALQPLRLPQALPLTLSSTGQRSLPQAPLFPRRSLVSRVASSPALEPAAASGGDGHKPQCKTDSANGQPRSVKELPGVGRINSLYWLFIRGYVSRFHELQKMHKERFGTMWTVQDSNGLSVCLANPDLIQELMRQEGPSPIRVIMSVWNDYQKMRGYSSGLVTQTGADWKRMREVLNQRLLKPREVMLYADRINAVVTDLLEHVRERRGGAAVTDAFPLTDVAALLYRYAFEGVTSILFETRMGSLNETIPKETQEFIDAIGIMLTETVYVMALPSWTRPLLPFWGRFVRAWDVIFSTAIRLVNNKLAEVEESISRGQEIHGEYLTYLLANGRLSMQEIYSNTTEIMLAGVDTTSNTTSWSLYHLARMPALQEALLREVTEVVPGDAVPGVNEVARMPLLKAIVKETLRLYPVVVQNLRQVQDDGFVIGGYSIPKGTHLGLCSYVMGLDEDIFPNAREFQPQRWLRGKDRAAWHDGAGANDELDAADVAPDKAHPFAYLPFGFGLRGCLGRRIAELEMHLFLARFVKMFEVMPEPGAKEILPKTRFILVASGPINLLLRERL